MNKLNECVDANLATQATVETEARSKKLLLGKRVVRAFAVRSNLRTGACNDTGDDSGPGYSCTRSR